MMNRNQLDSPDTLVATLQKQDGGGIILTAFGRNPMEIEATMAGALEAPDGADTPEKALRLWGTLDETNHLMEVERWQDPLEGAGLSILLCGGRDFQGWAAAERVLDRISPELIIHGAARGADSLAGRYARENKVPCREFPAIWRPQGPKGPVHMGAGHDRNQRMLDEGRPDIVLAFPGGGGTRDMVRRSRRQGFPVQVYDHRGMRRYGNPEVVPG